LNLSSFKRIHVLFVILAITSGISTHILLAERMDVWIHDFAVVHQARKEWKHTAIVVLDEKVPYMVGRKQALPLFALATERLVAAGAASVYLDARVSKEIENRMPYAKCIKMDGKVEWSMPTCSIFNNQCQVQNSELGEAPLAMSATAIQQFAIAPFFSQGEHLPDFLLFGWDAAENMPESGIQFSDRLVSNWSPVARWLDLSKDSAVYRLVSSVKKDNLAALYHSGHDQICDASYPCRRVRLSVPIYQVQQDAAQPVLPVSLLASCNLHAAMELAKKTKGKAVILQTTAPLEQTDRFITPMTTALFGPGLLTPGSQYIADEVETVLGMDHPQAPDNSISVMMSVALAFLGVWLAGYRPVWIWLASFVIFTLLMLLCVLNPIVQIWPVFALMVTFLVAVAQTMSLNLIIGMKEGRLIKQYMPKQIHNLLFSLKEGATFKNRRCQSAVLMSDLAGYTTLTGILKEPSLILALMNDYLNETAIVLQQKYNGWFESYIGDMVCYYWPYTSQADQVLEDAMCGAIELSLLQQRFFKQISKRYADKLDAATIAEIDRIIDAGIGLSVGSVVMGNLGPKNGVRKFGILGDPLNLASRIESLTRFFNTEIIMSSEFLATARANKFPVRRLGLIKVKGRDKPEMLYALGADELEPRFNKTNIRLWENWLAMLESGKDANVPCVDIYSKDMETLMNWKTQGLLGDDKVWYLNEK
jgi:adenylate cyclase